MDTRIHLIDGSIFKKIVFSVIFLNVCLIAAAQVTFTTSQTITTNQTYSGPVSIGTGTITIASGTTTINGSLTIGSGGALVIQNGAKVIANGVIYIGNSSNGNLVVQNGGRLTVNPGGSGGTAAVNINSSATKALDIQTGGSVIINAGSVASTLGMYQTAASKVEVAGSLQIRGGGFKMDNTARLTYSGSGNDTIIGPSNAGAYFSNSTKLTVGSGVNLYISGDVKNDSNAEFAINGNVSIVGNYQSGNTTANVTGTGTLNTTGSLDADGYQGSVFGQRYSCASGPCAGTNLISSSNTTTCNGGVVNILGVAVSGATYQWFVSTTSATSGFTSISGATAQNYSTTGSSTKQYSYYKRQYTLSGITYNSNTLTITSSFWVNAATVANISGATSVCAGSTTTLTNTTSGGVWSSSNTSVATINASGVVTGVSAGTSVISYTVNGSTCAASKTVTMTVGAATSITTQPIASTVCAGSNTSFSVATTGAGLTYIWKENGTNISNGGIYSGATSNTLSLTRVTSAQDNKSYSVYVQGTCGANILSNSGLLTVSSLPSVSSKSTSICSGTAFSVTPYGVPSGTTYTWTSPSGSNITGGSAQLTGQSSINQILTNTSVAVETAVYTVTPTSSCGVGSTFTVTVTVNPTTTIVTQPLSKTVCTGATTSFSVSATGLGLTYIWKESGGNLVDGGIYSGTSTATITLTGVPSTKNNKSYSVFIQGGCSSILSSVATLTVMPGQTAVAGTTVSTCSDAGSVNITEGASATNFTDINWTTSGTGTFANATSLTAATYTPSAADISVGSAILTLTATGSCSSITSTKSLIINGLPSIELGSYPTVCSGSTSSSVAYSAILNGANQYSINWSNAANAQGIVDVGYKALSGGVIPLEGLTTTAGVYGAVIKVKNSFTGCENICSTTSLCGIGNGGGYVRMTAPNKGTFAKVTFASYGNASGSCSQLNLSTCHAANSLSIVESACLGGNTFIVNATNAVFGDPCSGIAKSLKIAVLYSDFIITIKSCPIIWTGTTSADWNTAANWSPAISPTSADEIVIPSFVASGRMPTISTTVNAKSVTNNGTLTFTSAGALNVTGSISNTGTVTPVAGSTLTFVGNTAQSITGVPVLYNVTINNTSGGVSLGSAVTVRGTLSLTNGVLTTNSNLTINFDNGGNIGYNSSDLGSISGNVSGRRDVVAKTHYIAVPFSGVTSAQVQATTPLYVNTFWKMYTKDFTNQNWTAVINATTAMPQGTGFSLSLPAAAPLIFTGAYNHAYTYTGPTYSNAAANKYFMIGNPYPTTIDWSAASGWTKTNVANAIYYWDPANSRSASYVAGVGTNGATRYIPAMQSVLVTTTGSGGSSSISMTNDVRISSQTPSYFRVASDEIVRLTLTGSDASKSDEAVIRFNEMATDSFDYELDAHKILNSGAMPSVYTNLGTDMYSVNSYASVDSAKYIPVAAKLAVDGQYTLKVAGTNPNVDYVLVDKLLGTQQSIAADKAYSFSGSKTDDVNRFELQLRVSEVAVPTGVQSASMNSGLNIYSSTKGFVIKTDRYAGGEAEIEILDMTGNSVKVVSGKNLSMGSTYVPLDMADGAYLVKVSVDGSTFAGMIVLTK